MAYRDFESDPIRRALTDKITTIIKEQGRTHKWVAEKMGEVYSTFKSKTKFGSWSAMDLIKLGVILDFDLNDFKELFNLTPKKED